MNVFANLGWDEVRLPHPVLEGDTIYSRSKVLELRESSSRPTVGIVRVATEASTRTAGSSSASAAPSWSTSAGTCPTTRQCARPRTPFPTSRSREVTSVDLVTTAFFETLGVKPVYGRDFTLVEERPGTTARSVIVSYKVWERSGLDPAILTRTVRISGQDFAIVGVAPQHFTGTTAILGAEYYLPVGVHDAIARDYDADAHLPISDRRSRPLILVGRLEPGVTRVHLPHDRARHVASDLARGRAERGKDARLARHQDRAHPQPFREPARVEPSGPADITRDRRAFIILVRNACFRLVRALAARDLERALSALEELAPEPPEPAPAVTTPAWTGAALESLMAPYWAEHASLSIDASARARLPSRKFGMSL